MVLYHLDGSSRYFRSSNCTAVQPVAGYAQLLGPPRRLGEVVLRKYLRILCFSRSECLLLVNEASVPTKEVTYAGTWGPRPYSSAVGASCTPYPVACTVCSWRGRCLFRTQVSDLHLSEWYPCSGGRTCHQKCHSHWLEAGLQTDHYGNVWAECVSDEELFLIYDHRFLAFQALCWIFRPDCARIWISWARLGRTSSWSERVLCRSRGLKSDSWTFVFPGFSS